jgi:glycogen(starch) synthase
MKYGASLLEDHGKGRCYARNLGINKARGSVVVFLDDDVILEKDWLELVAENFNLDCRIGGVGGIPITMKEGKESSHLVIYDFIYELMVNNAEGLTGYQGWQGKDRPYKTKINVLSGSNMAFRRDILLRIGGFDENFYGPSIGEDVDLCLRVSRKGYYLILDPNLNAYHYSDHIERWSAYKNEPGFFFALADNQIYLPVKHQIIRRLNWFPYLLFRFSGAIYLMLKTRKVSILFYYLKGMLNGRMRGKSAAYYRLS